MKSYAANEIRDVALVGHGGAGKTTLAEAILFCTRRPSASARGRRHLELRLRARGAERRTSISAAVGHAEWKKAKINLVDTSGNGNFLVDNASRSTWPMPRRGRGCL